MTAHKHPVTRARNFQDVRGYGSTPADEAYGLFAGLLAGALLIAASFVGAVL